MRRASVIAFAALAGVVFLWWRRRTADESGDVIPKDPRPRQALIDTASEASFPASDPPSYWGREADP